MSLKPYSRVPSLCDWRDQYLRAVNPTKPIRASLSCCSVMEMKCCHTDNATATCANVAFIDGDSAFLIDAYGFGAIGYCDCLLCLKQGSAVEEEIAMALFGATTSGTLKKQ